MFLLERQQNILDLLRKKKKVFVSELTKKFLVSEVTIRKDLNELEKQNLVQRTHGGAIINKFLTDIPGINKRRIMFKQKKEIIGIKTSKLIEENETLMIDAGTTTYEVAKQLGKFNKLIVISNSLEICSLLINFAGIEVSATGGIINKNNLSMRGAMGVELLSKYTASKAIIGVDGFSLEHGLTASNELVSDIKKQMIKSSNIVIIVTDSSKFGRVSFSPVCGLEDIDIVVTDEDIPKEYIQDLKEMDISLLLAK